MKVFIKGVDGFKIYFEALQEDSSLSQLLIGDSAEQLKEIEDNNIIFCAKVSAEKAGIELGTDYLGGCIYESEEDFYNTEGDYFDDMVLTVITEAKENLISTIAELSN